MLCIICNCEFENNHSAHGRLCIECLKLEMLFIRLITKNRDSAYNWAMQKALDLAGNITGIEPGSAYIKVEDGKLTIETVEKVKTTVARYVPPELKK